MLTMTLECIWWYLAIRVFLLVLGVEGAGVWDSTGSRSKPHLGRFFYSWTGKQWQSNSKTEEPTDLSACQSLTWWRFRFPFKLCLPPTQKRRNSDDAQWQKKWKKRKLIDQLPRPVGSTYRCMILNYCPSLSFLYSQSNFNTHLPLHDKIWYDLITSSERGVLGLLFHHGHDRDKFCLQ